MTGELVFHTDWSEAEVWASKQNADFNGKQKLAGLLNPRSKAGRTNQRRFKADFLLTVLAEKRFTDAMSFAIFRTVKQVIAFAKDTHYGTIR